MGGVGRMAALLAAGCGGLVIVGAVGPWATIRSTVPTGDGVVSVSGAMSDQGKIALVGGIVAVACVGFAVVGGEWSGLLARLAALLLAGCGGLGSWAWVDAEGVADAETAIIQISVGVGWGIHASPRHP